MKHVQQFLLQIGFQVNHQVAAAEQMQLGKGRVAGDVLRRKNHHAADLLADAVTTRHLGEETRQALGRHIGGNVVGVKAAAGFLDGILVHVGGENLHRKLRRRLDLFQRLDKQHGQRVSLFPGGAGRHPGAQHAAFRVGAQQFGQDLSFQALPDLGVAEKTGHANQ